ncbi:MAG: histidine kinase [Nocardioidaceae bacterium]
MTSADDPARAAFLRSTSMPVVPVSEPVPPSGATLDEQLLELFFDRVPMGVAVFGTDLRLKRCNKTWTQFYDHYMGVPPEYTAPGRHLNELIPGNEEAVKALADEALAGRVVRRAAQRIWTQAPLDAQGTPTGQGIDTYWDVVFAPLFADGRVVGVVDIVTDATDRVLSITGLQERVATFSRLAAGMSIDQPLASTLAEVVDAVRRTTSAMASSVLCWEETADHTPTAYADPVLGDGYAAALEEVFRRRGVTDLAVPEGYDVPIHRDLVQEALADPVLEPLYPYLQDPVWRDASIIPMVVSGVQVGELCVFLAAGQDLHADERAYLRALADQAAVAVRNSTLFRAAERTAGLEERHRLARDLHDSVSQALFSMTLHARTAQRHLAAAGLEEDSPVAVEVDRLHALTQAALAEMRALIFELRPGALAAEGLAGGLRKQAAALSAREQLPIEVRAGRERFELPAEVEEQLYRLALEALHNAIKHAAATGIEVRLDRDAGDVVVSVVDDGCGFDPSVPRPGHLGMETMRDRAAAVGATLTITSAPGTGTRVETRLPLR